MNNYKTFYENTIIEAVNGIDFEGYDNVQQSDDLLANIKSVYNIFVSEYDHEIKRRGEVKAFSEWLRGLPILTVPFYYDEILNNALLAGVNVKNEEDFLEKYWDKLAVAFFTLKDNL